MSNDNPFPESPQKAYLRRIHFNYLASRKKLLDRELAYFGLPSAQMLDVKLWRPVLGHITAVEKYPNIALSMYRTAQMLKVRQKMILLEKSLVEVVRLLAMDDDVVRLLQLPPSEQDKIRRIRGIQYDVINLDLCGGFLYPKQAGDSENVETLSKLILFQAKHKHPFVLILTFNLRDTGKDDYDNFIDETLEGLERFGIDTCDVRTFYTAKQIKGQPPQLRRLRFCVPGYLHRVAFQHFQVSSLGAWYYKTFYHTALFFDPRKGGSILGLTWPPPDEFKELLRTPMMHVTVGQDEQIIPIELPAPMFT